MVDDHTMVGRAFTVIDACLADSAPTTLAALTRMTGLPKPTVRRIAEDLTHRGLLTRTPAGYTAGPSLAAYATRALRDVESTRHHVTPQLTDLHGRTGAVTCVIRTECLDQWHLTASIYNQVAADSGYAEAWPRDAMNPAILASAFGQVALAGVRDHAEDLLRTGVPRMTPYTARHPMQISRALDRAHTDGEALEHEGLVEGWSCLAVPIGLRDQGTPFAVLAVVDTAAHFNTRTYMTQAHLAATSIEKGWLPAFA